MKKNVKKLLLLIAVVITAVVCFTFSVSALDATGKIGDNVTYSYNNQTKQLVISGSGKMWDYYNYDSPFCKSDIKEVVIENGVTSISYYAFYYCRSLTSITIPDSVTLIGDYAFFNCTSLTSITIPDSVTLIGDYAFFNCTSLTSIIIPESVTLIDVGAFGFCTSLASVTIPDSVTSIGRYAFRNCTSLTSITIPDSVTTIGDLAFGNCTAIKDLTMPVSARIYETMHTLYESSESNNPFKDCINIEKITLTKGTGKMQSYMDFDVNFSNYTFAVAEHYKYTPWYISRCPTVVIEDGVENIGEYAFCDCNELTSITIPESVTAIGEGAFAGCSSLTGITVDANNKNYSSDKYGVLFDKNKTNLIQYPMGATHTIYNIPDSVTTMGAYAFYYCTSLKELTIPVSVKTYTILFDNTIIEMNFTFEGCTNIEKITLTKGTGKMVSYSSSTKGSDTYYEYTPWYMTKCPNVILEDGVKNISANAFRNCDSLTSITIPESVTAIGDDAFYDCANLKILYEGSESAWKNIYQYEFREVHYLGCKAVYTSEIIKNPTCASEGEKLCTCSCGKTYSETITSLGHKYSSSYTTDKKATCTSEGSKSMHCTRNGCTAKTTKSISALGHAYSSSYTVDKKATCTKAGSKSQHCTRSGCTAKKNVKSISALGHSYGAYKTTKKATPSVNGTKVKTCSACSAKYTATIYKPSSFKLSATSYTYNGKAKKPTVTVKDSKGSTLKNGTDYKVTYSANTAIGTAKATVTLMGNYSGSKVLTFKIILGATDKIKATQTASTVKLSWNKVAGAKGYKIYVYDSKGELQLTKSTTKTSITVDDLSKGTKYKFTVKAYAVVSKKTVWSEKTKSLTTATKPGQPTLKATAGKGKVSLSWTKQNGSNGYVVYMATSKKSDYKKIATLEGVANLKMTKSKLKKGKKYYFKVRAYKTVGSTKVYGAWSSVKSVKVK